MVLARASSYSWAPLLLCLGILSYAIGQIIYTIYEQVLRYSTEPFPSWADAAFLIVYPFFLLGILLLPTRPIPLASRTRVVIDGLMIMTALVTFSWFFVLGPTITEGADSLFAQIVGAAYPFCDLLLIVCLLVLTSRIGGGGRSWLYMLQIALSIIVLSDTVFDYQTLHNAYHTGSLLDDGWPLGFMLVGLAVQQFGAESRLPQPTCEGGSARAGCGSGACCLLMPLCARGRRIDCSIPGMNRMIVRYKWASPSAAAS